MVQTRVVRLLQSDETGLDRPSPNRPSVDRPSHSTPVPNRVRTLPYVISRDTTVRDGLRASADRDSWKGAASRMTWLATGAVTLCLAGFVIGVLLGHGASDPAAPGGGLVVDGPTIPSVLNVPDVLASASGACGHDGLRTRMCAVASQGSFVAQLNY